MASIDNAKDRMCMAEPAQMLYRYRYDFARHLTTLSSGGILFVSAYLGLTAQVPHARLMILISASSFGLSLLVSFFEMLVLTRQGARLGFHLLTGAAQTDSGLGARGDKFIFWGQRVAVGLFLIGVGLAAVFMLMFAHP